MAYTATNDKLRGRIRDLDLGSGSEYIDFFYVPEEITDSVTPEWNPITVIGRSAPIHAYSGTGARSLALELNFFAEADAYNEVFKKVAWIQSLKYPEYIGKRMKPPHKVSLIVGRFIALDGILMSAEVSWKAPYDVETKFPMFATVSVTIEEVVENPYDYRVVRDAVRIGYGDPDGGTTGFSAEKNAAGKTVSSVLRNRTIPAVVGGSSVAISGGDF